jgi:hypothetical protein
MNTTSAANIVITNIVIILIFVMFIILIDLATKAFTAPKCSVPQITSYIV